MKIIGSQVRETLKEASYRLVGKLEGAVILEDEATGKWEI